MSDEQIEALLKKNFQGLANVKRNIWLVVFLMCVVILYVATQVKGSLILIILIALSLFIVVKLINNLYIKKLNKQWKKIEKILYDDCDSELFYRILAFAYDNYSQSKIVRLIIISNYLQACLAQRMSNKAKELLKDPFFVERVLLKNPATAAYTNMEIAAIDNDSKLFESNYQKLMDMVSNNDEKAEAILKMVNIDYLFYKGNYKQFLDILPKTETDTQYAKVTVSYMKGYALFQLRDYKEAKVNFEYVIEYGNTLPIVEMAKQLLMKID
ncbi:hypothetical protein [Breznakia pachnodae]|uniref:Tetratricopeptide (TPR) repeat protein n=1 Tax=Breznakia pachnodae TaxID=265178 RepID=A0ABU0E339_9FIRM|nr:hypothetical protein [Breznakia pachnodae]MDQ0361308.1 tetratricopeptide (TPR) repeat protein [Breznakia pachnodae]